MIIVGKLLSIDNYKQYKRVINQITRRLYMHVYIYTLETKKLVVFWCVCMWLSKTTASEPFIKLCF